MSEALKIAQIYIDAWNETNAQKRQALLQSTWTPDATYVDPLAASTGLAEINDLIGGVQARFPTSCSSSLARRMATAIMSASRGGSGPRARTRRSRAPITRSCRMAASGR